MDDESQERDPVIITWDHAQRWAKELGMEWISLCRKAGVSTDPATQRSYKQRWNDGKFPENRRDLVATLVEEDRKRPTSAGRLAAALRNWHEMGLEIAELDEAQFLELAGRLPAILDGIKARRGGFGG